LVRFFFWSFREIIKSQFAKRSSTIVISAKIVSGSNKKTIWIPQKGDASFMIFFGVLTNANWKVASRTCHFHRLLDLLFMNSQGLVDLVIGDMLGGVGVPMVS
jgi:hypothetical protein